jgi:hypothetical protein
MIKRDKTGEFASIQCDTCETPSPPTAEILAGGGLVQMGWHCSGGSHYCPTCEHPAQGWPKVPERTKVSAGGGGG